MVLVLTHVFKFDETLSINLTLKLIIIINISGYMYYVCIYPTAGQRPPLKMRGVELLFPRGARELGKANQKNFLLSRSVHNTLAALDMNLFLHRL